MSEETKQRIIEAGAELVHTRGFNNTGLKDILRAAEVPKGSFYFYFDSKEAFGMEMVSHFGRTIQALTKPILADDSLSPLEQLRAIFNTFHTHFEKRGFTRGCPIGNLAQEMSDLSPPFRTRLEEAMEGMTSLFQGIIERAIESGEVPEDIDARDTALFIIEAWHGAIIRMKVTQNGTPLNICYKFVFDKILA